MKLSTTTRYGLRALCDLCTQASDRPVAVSDIARRQDIPVNYLEQLFAKLRRGKLIRSVRGAQGGYLLSRPASQIAVAEVVEALGEPIAFGDCQMDSGCVLAPTCPTFALWRKIKGAIDGILAETTLEDILRDGRRLLALPTPDPVREEVRERALRSRRPPAGHAAPRRDAGKGAKNAKNTRKEAIGDIENIHGSF